jgi:hypothetical protein
MQLLNNLRCSHKNSKIKATNTLNRKKQEKEERYPETKGLLSLVPNDNHSVINESEQNCCKNEITINNQLQDNNQVTIKDECQTEEPSRIRHDRQRNNSAKIRYKIVIGGCLKRYVFPLF